MDSVFLNLVRGNRVNALMGLELDGGGSPKFSSDYCYIEVGLKEFFLPTEEKIVTKALRNQHVRIVPACKLNLRGNYRILVKTNPKLQEVSNCPAMFVLDTNEGEQPWFYATMRKDVDVSDLTWCVRLYMLA